MQITKTIYLHWSPSPFVAEGTFSAWDTDMGNCASYSPCLAKLEVTFDVQESDPRTITLELLRAKKAKIIEDATAQADSIDQKIEELLALPQLEPTKSSKDADEADHTCIGAPPF